MGTLDSHSKWFVLVGNDGLGKGANFPKTHHNAPLGNPILKYIIPKK